MDQIETPPANADPPTADGEIDYDYTPQADPAEAAPQVSSYIAIIRIVSVLAMGLCVSFGLFMMLIGQEALFIGIGLVLLAIPCYYGMRFAERLASQRAARAGAR